MERPLLHEIPGPPVHCGQVLIWQERILPVMDIGARLPDRPSDNHAELVGIVAYQEEPAQLPAYGALLLNSLPRRISVDDDQACGLPDDPMGWATLSISCFSDGNGAIPILDLSRIFSDSNHAVSTH